MLHVLIAWELDTSIKIVNSVHINLIDQN